MKALSLNGAIMSRTFYKKLEMHPLESILFLNSANISTFVLCFCFLNNLLYLLFDILVLNRYNILKSITDIYTVSFFVRFEIIWDFFSVMYDLC